MNLGRLFGMGGAPVSRTIIPMLLPASGDAPGDTENPLFDDAGTPIFGGITQAVLDAISKLARKIDTMSGTVTTIAEDVAELTADAAAMTTAIQEIATIIGTMQTGTLITADQKAALDAAVASIHASAQTATTLATGTATATATST